VSRIVRIAIAAVLALALAPVAQAAGKHQSQVAKAARACPDADLDATARNLGRIRKAVLRQNRRLHKAAVGHSKDMVRHDYFEHTTPKGVTMLDRILRSRYVRADQGWVLGENLAWGTGAYGTPRGAVEAWMNSAGHRENILRGAYRDVGIGVVLGVPGSKAVGATYTLDFGVRR
jgi:uncharacterized protein YkwD